MLDQKMIVVSVGGSLIVPTDIDTQFLTSFKTCIHQHIQNGYRFIIITGGGKTARHYQEAARSVTPLTNKDLDWIGIHATRLNGHLLRAIFYDVAYPTIIDNPEKLTLPFDKPVIIAAGWRPGHSTDFVAVEIAKHFSATKLANLSNIDYVYTADPKKDPNAQPIETIAWNDFRALLPPTWDPGLSSPFDPIAAKDAQEAGMEVGIINGTHLDDFNHFVRGEPFTGTRIKN
jgi:uridylate kinase